MEGWREKVCERGTELLDQGERVVTKGGCKKCQSCCLCEVHLEG